MSIFIPGNFFRYCLFASVLTWFSYDSKSIQTSTDSNHTTFCASAEANASRMETDPGFQSIQNKLELNYYQHVLNSSLDEKKMLQTLPVVVHIIHQNGNENIDNTLIQSGIEHLNESFRNLAPYDPSTGVDTEIAFCLARRTPDGQATDGINRIESPLTEMTLESQDVDVKNLSRWDPTKYINIWLVREICSASSGCGVAGYAYFPAAHGSNIDGIMMEARWFGTTPGNSAVITHEMGHYLGLYHTFQGGCGNTDCLTDGDRVCDTPPDQSTVPVPCSGSVNSCSTDVNTGDPNNAFTSDENDMFWNYMDYGDWDCYSAFTDGQKNRMHSFMNGVRSSLLVSDGCLDPCTDPVVASIGISTTDVDVGSTIMFNNQSTNANTFEWFVNGNLESTATGLNYTFSTEGKYQIRLTAYNDDPNCIDSDIITMDVRCPVKANFSISKSEVMPNETVSLTNISENAVSYEWLVEGITESTDTDLVISFPTVGTYDVQLIADNGICKDTSFLAIITVSNEALAQTGLPVWPVLTDAGVSIQSIDWQSQNPIIKNIPSNNIATNFGQTGAAFTDCGDLAFFVVHSGSSDPNQLFIYAPDGTPLLTNTTPQGPGLNCVRGGNEIQVVPVPQDSDEWYIIYNDWSTDVGSPINHAGYNPANILYSRVRLEPDGSIQVIIRDLVIRDNNNVAHTYTDGKAVSRTLNGDPNGHFLYACRRNGGQNSLSLDRFQISNSGISFDRNTGTVSAPYWNLTFAGSPIELSPTEEHIAVVQRNQSNGQPDIFVFDAITFSNTSVRSITGGDLILQADGTGIDQSNVLPSSGRIQDVANNSLLPLRFLRNYDRKIQGVEFSPNGRFLYMIGGGFVSGGFTNITYLSQIDLESNPLEVRLQIQEPPNGTYDPLSGRGCSSGDQSCLDNYESISHIESAFNGNLYFLKRFSETLSVIPDPNNIMPQNLIPSSIDLFSPTEQNIPTAGEMIYLPDQIDGYLYLDEEHTKITFYVDNKDCLGNCVTPYNVEILQDNILVEAFVIDQCPDTISVCLERSASFDLFNPATQMRFENAITNSIVQYPNNLDVFDFSEDPECIEICDNEIDDDGDGLTDCEDPDLQDSCCCIITTLELDLGPDIIICENGVATIEATPGFESYIWQDGFDQKDYTAFAAGTYWLNAFDGCNWHQDTIEIILDELSVLDLGPDRIVCSTDSVTIDVPGFDRYDWYPADMFSCDNCPSNTVAIEEDTEVILVVSNQSGCFTTDTLILLSAPSAEAVIDTSVCESLIHDGVELFPGDSYIFNYMTTMGCDSTVEFRIDENQMVFGQVDTLLCSGESLFHDGIEILPGESVQFDYISVQGCDSVFIINTFEEDTMFTELDTILCFEESLNVAGEVIDEAGIYSFVSTGANGCDSTTIYHVVYHEELTLEFNEVYSVLINEEVVLNPEINSSGIIEYIWSPPTYLSCSDCENPVASPLQDITYNLTVKSVNGCEVTRSIFVDVNTDKFIYVPNVFSPNNDGTNDLFYLFGNENVSGINELLIYDRWGELVFELDNFPVNDPVYSWDGTFNAQACAEGVYTYLTEVNYADGITEIITGNVTLLR